MRAQPGRAWPGEAGKAVAQLRELGGMKPDEFALLRLVRATHDKPFQAAPFVRDIGTGAGVHRKRLWYLCTKWAGKGWYDYGTSCDLGWLTAKGILEIDTMLAAAALTRQNAGLIQLGDEGLR